MISRRMILAAGLGAVVSGCAARGLSADARQRVDALKASRDSGAISWRAWAAAYENELRAAYPDGITPGMNAIFAQMHVVAERVDAKTMTPAEGRLALAQAIAAEDRNAQIEAALNRPAPAPRPATCIRSGIFINCF